MFSGSVSLNANCWGRQKQGKALALFVDFLEVFDRETGWQAGWTFDLTQQRNAIISLKCNFVLSCY